MTDKKKTPLIKLKDGGLCLSIWENIIEDGTVRHSISFEKNFKPEGKDWQKTYSYAEYDLLRISRLFIKAYDAISDLK